MLHALTLTTLKSPRVDVNSIVLGPTLEASIIEVPLHTHAFVLPHTIVDLKPIHMDTEAISARLPNLAAYDPTIESPVDLAAVHAGGDTTLREINTAPTPDPRFPLPSADRFYPPASAQAHEHGTVRVSALVQADGLIGEVRLDQSSGSLRLDEAALQYAKSLHLIPGQRSGQVMSRWISVELSFGGRRSFARLLASTNNS